MATTGPDEPITFVISVAAELAGMHPQTVVVRLLAKPRATAFGR